MDEYIKQYGFTPSEYGLNNFISSNAKEASAKVETSNRNENKSDIQGSSMEIKNNTELKNLPLTMVYIPFQQLDKKYSESEALKAGTLFPELDKPFLGKKAWL